MQMEVSFGTKTFSVDLLDGILDHLWASHESEENVITIFGCPETPPRYYGKESLEVVQRFSTILALSLTCSTFRQLCLPRLFGTIYVRHFKTLGLLWKSIQSNPTLGSYVHSFTIRIAGSRWPPIIEPSDGLGSIFVGQTMDDLATEVKKVKPGAWNRETERDFRKYCRKGPDGVGIDSNLKNAQDLKEALLTIFCSLKYLAFLQWETSSVPLLSCVIAQLAKLDSLTRVSLNFFCCEEDFFLPTPPAEGNLQPSTPVWKLSNKLKELKVADSGPGLRDFEGILDESEEYEKGPRLERQTNTLIKTIDESENLEKITLERMGYFGEDENRPEVLLALLPRLCCIPSISLKWSYTSPEWEKWDVTLLHPALLSLSERKGTLAAEDIRSLGKDAEKSIDHPLSAFASFLQEEELSEKIVERWNKRYSSG